MKVVHLVVGSRSIDGIRHREVVLYCRIHLDNVSAPAADVEVVDLGVNRDVCSRAVGVGYGEFMNKKGS